MLCHYCNVKLDELELVDNNENVVKSKSDAIAQIFQCPKYNEKQIH